MERSERSERSAERGRDIAFLVEQIFNYFPKAEIYGNYVIHHILNKIHRCREIDLFLADENIPSFNPKSTMTAQINIFVARICLQNSLIEIINHKTWIYDQIMIYRLIIKLNRSKITINFSNGFNPPYQGCFWVTGLKINKRWDIVPYFETSHIASLETMKERMIGQINDKILISMMAPRFENEYIKRITYIKIVKDSIPFIKNGWKMNRPFENFKYSIYHEDQENQENQENHECGICLENVNEGTTLVLECGHLTHLNCLEEQMLNSGIATCDKCPICRKDLIL